MVTNNLISNFREKANFFNDFFVQQCQPIANNSILPTNQIFHTQNRLRDFDIDCGKILKLINGLNSYKGHGHDRISMQMVKLCNLTTKPLSVIYKNSKQTVNNYRPVSLLPICSKIFEKLIFDSIYDFIDKINLFKNNQLGFRPSDSCIHQLIAITHKIFSAYNINPSLEVRAVFVDLSKVFDRVWHDGFFYKLKSNGIDGNVFKLIKSFLNNRCQRVVLNGQSSVWKSVTAGVPQGSFLGPLFFLIYINDLRLGLTTNVKLFEDDTSLFSVVNNASVSASRLNNDLVKMRDWAFNWKMSFNPDPIKQAKEVIFSKKTIPGTHPFLFFNNLLIEQDTTQEQLCLTLDHKHFNTM